MKETPLTNCAKDFIRETTAQKLRLDRRGLHDHREVKISYGVARGCCNVDIGDTRVLAQVSCEVAEPKLHRPTDGVLYINVEMSPMTSPGVEFGRPPEECVEIQRILERTLKESRCLDLESLCIVASKQVWQIRADIHCVNNAGNLLDACSIAAIAALAHFRLPDVSIDGDTVTIHSVSERDPIPLSLVHMPLCCTFAFFSQGKLAFIDPSREEERVMEGKLVVGMNKHRELCCLQSTGSMLLQAQQVLRCSNIAVQKVADITKVIQEALENDSKARAAGQKCGMAVYHTRGEETAHSGQSDADRLKGLLPSDEQDDPMSDNASSNIADSDDEPQQRSKDSGREIGTGGSSAWDVDEEMTDVLLAEKPRKDVAPAHNTADFEGSDEETCTLGAEQFDFKPTTAAKSKKKRKKKT